MKLSRQAGLIVDHLYANSHITSWQAEGVYRIRRLASRISELKRMGYEIQAERARDATGQLYTRYAFTRKQRRRSTPVNAPTQEQPRFCLTHIVQLYRDYCARVLDIQGNDLDSETAGFHAHLHSTR